MHCHLGKREDPAGRKRECDPLKKKSHQVAEKKKKERQRLRCAYRIFLRNEQKKRRVMKYRRERRGAPGRATIEGQGKGVRNARGDLKGKRKKRARIFGSGSRGGKRKKKKGNFRPSANGKSHCTQRNNVLPLRRWALARGRNSLARGRGKDCKVQGEREKKREWLIPPIRK